MINSFDSIGRDANIPTFWIESALYLKYDVYTYKKNP